MMGSVEELAESLARDAEPVRPAPHPFMLAARWLAAAGVYIVVSLAISGLRPDLATKLAEPWFVLEILFLGGLLLSSSLGAALLAFPDMHQKRGAAYAPFGILALFALSMLVLWYFDNPGTPLPPHSYQCTVSIALFALLPAAWIFYGMRRLASTHQHLAGGIALLYALGVGALWLRLVEQNDSILHVIQWHYLPMLAFSACGLWLGRRLLKW